MSGIAPISGNVSFSSTSAADAVGGAPQAAGANAAEMLSGAMALQVAGSMQAAGGAAGIDPMATLALALLLQRGNSSQEKQDPFQMLAMMAMMGGMQSGGVSASFSFNVSGVDQAYSGGTVAAAQMSAQA